MEYQDYREYRSYFETLIAQKNLKELKSVIGELNVVDIAEIIEDMGDKEMLLVFRMLPKEMSAEVFSYMERFDQMRLVNSITDIELTSIIDELDFDDMIDVLEEMPANVVTKVLANTPSNERKLINEFLRYPESSAGSIMTIEYVDLRPDMTVREALDHIKKIGMDKETIYTCYVENEYKMLIGFVSLRTLVVSDVNKIIREIMVEDVVSVNTLDDQEEVAEKFIRYGYIALPVVDGEHRLCGIITFDDIMNVVESEATEDFHKMAAIAPSDDEYLDQTPWDIAKHRLPWLLVLMISATLTGGIIDRYNYIIAQYLILSTFIPMMTDTGGNSGSQSSTTVIRALATGEIGLSDWWKVIGKEISVGVIAGVILSFVNFLRIYFFTQADFKIAFLVSITMVVTVILSKLLGAVLPLFAKKINIDPAIMASAVITTIIDTVVLVIYFNLAKLFLPIA